MNSYSCLRPTELAFAWLVPVALVVDRVTLLVVVYRFNFHLFYFTCTVYLSIESIDTSIRRRSAGVAGGYRSIVGFKYFWMTKFNFSPVTLSRMIEQDNFRNRSKQIYFGNVFQNIFSDFWFPNCIKIFFKKFELSVVKAVFEALFSEQDSCQLFRKNKAWKVRAVNCC